MGGPLLEASLCRQESEGACGPLERGHHSGVSAPDLAPAQLGLSEPLLHREGC